MVRIGTKYSETKKKLDTDSSQYDLAQQTCEFDEFMKGNCAKCTLFAAHHPRSNGGAEISISNFYAIS